MEEANTKTGSGAKKALLAATAIIVIIGAGAVGAKVYYERQVKEFVASSGATAGSIKVDFQGRIHIRDLKLPLKEGEQITVGAIDGRPKLPYLDGVFEFGDITVVLDERRLVIPSARVEDLAIGDPERFRVARENPRISSSRMAERFSAGRISVPELTLTELSDNIEKKTDYTNTVLVNILHGWITSYSIDRAITVETASGGGAGASKVNDVVTSVEDFAGQDLDFARLVQISTENAGPEDTQMKPLYGPFSMRKFSVLQAKNNASCEEIRADGISTRMPPEPMSQILSTFRDAPEGEDLSPELRQAYFAKMRSVLETFGAIKMEFTGCQIVETASDSEPQAKPITIAADRANMRMEGYKLDFEGNGIKISRGDDRIAIDQVSLNGFDWHATAQGLQEMVGLEDDQMKMFDFYRLTPEFGRFKLAGVDFDGTDDEKPIDPNKGGQQRIKFKWKNFETALTKPVNGIPSDIEVKLEDFFLPVPENSPGFSEAHALGIQSFTFSYALSAGWDEPNNNLVIRKVSISGKDLGRVELSGLVSGFTREFFSFKSNPIQTALFGVTGRQVTLEAKDEGFLNVVTKLYALQNNISEAQARTTLTLGASFLLQQFAAERPQLRGATDALAAFMIKPGTLTVTVKAKNPNGLGIFDLAAASQDPLILLDKVDIQAAAE